MTEGQPSPGARRAVLWWALLVIPLWGVLIFCTHAEPVMRDGWGHEYWHRHHEVGLRSLYEFAAEDYLHQNPRLGQLVTLLIYTPGPYHAIATPIAELALFALLTALALGRVPSVRRADDALVAAIVGALVVACAPQIGPMLFYRPYTGNYTFGLVINLAWLVPYRLELAAPRPPRYWLALPMLVLGALAGFCNEHTGLAFGGLAVLAIAAAWARPDRRCVVWMIAGLVGLAAGYALLLTAPAQHVRYGGLADQAGIVERITQRGLRDNFAVIGVLLGALVWMLPAIALGAVERWRRGPTAHSAIARWTPLALALAGLACTLTVLASPKIGPRLYLASVALVAAGVASWLAVQLRGRWARRLAAVVAAAVLIYASVRVIAIHRAIGPLGETRLARLVHAAPGSAVRVPRYPVGTTRYFLGDDFLVPTLRATVANLFAIQSVELEH